jgi:two-component system OmpR family response regulator
MVGDDIMVVPRRELALLEALMMRARRVVQREVLLDEVFGFDDEIQSNTLDAHVSRLRGRLNAAKAGVVIHPVRGVGYLLDLHPGGK